MGRGPVTTFSLNVSCPTCSGPVGLLNAHSNGSLSIAIVVCDSCRKEWEITARMTFHGRAAAAVAADALAKREAKRRARELVSA